MAVTSLQSPFVFHGTYTALRSAYHPPLSKTLKLHHLPNLPLGTPSSWLQSLQGLLWLCACSLFNALWNVVSLQGIISQGAKKEHGTDYQKNHCNADILLIGKNLHHQRSKHLILFNYSICFLGSHVLITANAHSISLVLSQCQWSQHQDIWHFLYLPGIRGFCLDAPQ